VREDPRWARIALLLNLVGTILLALSFQATSSDFRLVTAKDFVVPGNYGPSSDTHLFSVFALCTKDRTLIAEGTESPRGPSLILSAPGCPDSANARSAAVVNTEHPSFLYMGLIFSALGFFIQLLIVPRRKTLAEVNDEMRILRKQRKMLEVEAERKP
jgi:hypothetical protein